MLSNQDLVLDNFKKKISSLPLWIPGAHVYDNPHFIAVDCGLPSDTFNVFLPLSSLTKDTQVSVQQAIRSFLDKGFPISIWMDQRFVTPDVVELFAELGKNEAERNITMKLESGSIGSSAPMAAGLEIKRVKSADELLQYAGVFQSLFAGSREQESLVHYFDQAAANFHIDQQHQWFVGFLDNQAVSTGYLIETENSYGIYDVMTRAEHRGKGLGSAMFDHLLQQVREEGNGKPCVLQASEDGINIYRRAGFTEVGEMVVFE
ncbi:N-acetyltransferase [Brevibacillus reuszeri]|uniref:N-acetyltransferase n=1 Tax=Brevibacillus reuszeri TaxID=54915 RepID=A0A0K9YRE7_9BACL|nr:GNAT family N-acetyltransferase [Brevibacillus reuszeri]KNB70765.1 hypothetical protein ADS79_18055 [Brevibacillus reuszeri]MED1857142.1 GNAT family N-acetyltransferase [Brevibacillus reuszeri]GED67036.1 N-acetyltransferase [Brevibacillus reuszeri]